LCVLSIGVSLAIVFSQGRATAQSQTGGESSVATFAAPRAPSASASSPIPSVSDMVSLAGGSFQLDGAITLAAPFQIDRTEVTVAQWERCVAAGACSAEVGTVNVKGAQAWSSLCNWPRRSERGDHPINCVSHDQAQTFCLWAQKRLPSEAEWYFAAFVSAGERTYPWAEGALTSGTVNLCGTECVAMLRSSGLVKNKEPLDANYSDPFADTGPVSALVGDSTPVGVIGLGGNVAEWTATAHEDKRVRCRGGSWLTSKLSDASKSAVFALPPEERRANFGFRCAR